MTFSIRDLFLVTVIVALAVAWSMDRLNSRKELQGVQLRLALEKDNNKHLTIRAKVLADSKAIMEAASKEYFERDAVLRAGRDDAFKRAIEAARSEGRAEGSSPPPTSLAPAPIQPKK